MNKDPRYGFALLGLAVGGWIANIYKLTEATGVSDMVIARGIGIVVFPLGVLLGYF